MTTKGRRKSHEIRVIAYAGHRIDDRPLAVILDGERLDVKEIEKSWISTGIDTQSDISRGFVVRCTGGARFRLLCGEQGGWKGELIPGPRLVR